MRKGKSRQKTFGYLDTIEEARLVKAEAIRDREDGMALGTKGQTMEVFLPNYVEMRWALEQISRNTYEKYKSINRLHLIPEIGHISLNKLRSAEHLDPLWVRKMSQGIGASHIRDMRSLLVSALSYAVKKKLVHYNEASLSEYPKFTIPEFETLTEEQAQRFRAAVKSSRYEALYLAGFYIGLRRGEIVGLAWEKIDWTERTLTIDQQVMRVGGKASGGGRLVIAPSKGNKVIIWPLNETLYQCLYALWLAQGQPTEGLLFRGIKDQRKPLDPMTWYRDFKRQLRLAGIPANFRGHDLRHTAATNIINRGGTTKDAAVMLGHQSTRHTERYARRLNMERKRQIAELMEKMSKGQD